MNNRALNGLTVLGTEPGCGKTVTATGLGAILQEEKLNPRVIKPICAASKAAAQPELSFISTITNTPLTYPIHYLSDAGLLNNYQWSQTIRTCTSGFHLTIAELPGGCTTMLSQSASGWADSAQLASELGWPCLLVARQESDYMDKLLLNYTYLQSKRLTLIGLVLVATTAQSAAANHNEKNRGFSHHLPLSTNELLLSSKTGVPFLGTVSYSQSIDVHTVNQGNLKKTVSASLDLLPILKALNFRVCV